MKSELRRGMSVQALAGLVAILGATACRSTGRATDPFTPGPEGGTGRIEVSVQNINFNDANFFALKQGQRIRLGSVTGKTDQTFHLDWNFSALLGFEARLIGGETCRVPELVADPGDLLWVRIPSELSVTQCTAGKR